uniref:Ovule protein n=2 Tax=Caenorhabditis tropicalis TaxID=1561998 RepID=A0A1I7UQ62_9PELO
MRQMVRSKAFFRQNKSWRSLESVLLYSLVFLVVLLSSTRRQFVKKQLSEVAPWRFIFLRQRRRRQNSLSRFPSSVTFCLVLLFLLLITVPIVQLYLPMVLLMETENILLVMIPQLLCPVLFGWHLKFSLNMDLPKMMLFV